MPNPEYLKCECQHCAGIIEFPAEGIGQSITCPHCGQGITLSKSPSSPGKPTRRAPVWLIVIILLAATVNAITFFLFKKPAPAPAPEKVVSNATNLPVVATAPGEIATNNFIISAIKLEKTTGSSLVYVTGKVRNLGDKQRYGVKLEFGLFDTNDHPVGKATDFHQILEPHGDWHFKALVLDSKATSAHLNAIRED